MLILILIMKTLVAYYSRTGNTKKVAVEIAKNLKADIDEIIDKKDRSGMIGWIIGGYHGTFKKLTEIEYKKDPEKYNLVIIGSPIWNGVTPAVRTYLKNDFKKIIFFCTQGGSGGEKCFKEFGKTKDILVVREKEIKDESYKEKVREFCAKIK